MIRHVVSRALVAVSILLAGCGGGGGGESTTHAVTYLANGATGGSVPVDPARYAEGATVTVLGNTGGLVDAGHAFSGWNTAAAGTGTHRAPGQTFTMGSADVALYAQWSAAGTLSVSYDGNGATSGTAPVDAASYDADQTVTVLGNTGGLAYPGYQFVGWQTEADGSGTTYAPGATFIHGSASVTLHALWAGGFAYAADHNGGGEGAISQFWIGPGGALTPMLPATVDSGGTDPRFLAVDPAGQHLYVSNINANKVGQFTIGADGALAAMTPATVAEATYPQGIAVHPTGLWAYVANNQSGDVSQYAIGTGGTLTPLSPASVLVGGGWPMAPNLVKVHPSGKWAYVTCGGGKAVAQFGVGTDGTLTALSPATVTAGSNAYGLTLTTIASGDYAYVTNYDTGAVWQYQVGPDGTLAHLATTPSGVTYAFHVAVHPTGKWAYAAVLGGTPASVIAQFDVGSDGTLTLMSTPFASAGGTAAAGIAVEASGKYLYATSGESGWGSSTVSQLTIDQATGALTPMGHPTVRAGATGPGEIVTVRK